MLKYCVVNLLSQFSDCLVFALNAIRCYSETSWLDHVSLVFVIIRQKHSDLYLIQTINRKKREIV